MRETGKSIQFSEFTEATEVVNLAKNFRRYFVQVTSFLKSLDKAEEKCQHLTWDNGECPEAIANMEEKYKAAVEIKGPEIPKGEDLSRFKLLNLKGTDAETKAVLKRVKSLQDTKKELEDNIKSMNRRNSPRNSAEVNAEITTDQRTLVYLVRLAKDFYETCQPIQTNPTIALDQVKNLYCQHLYNTYDQHRNAIKEIPDYESVRKLDDSVRKLWGKVENILFQANNISYFSSVIKDLRRLISKAFDSCMPGNSYFDCQGNVTEVTKEYDLAKGLVSVKGGRITPELVEKFGLPNLNTSLSSPGPEAEEIKEQVKSLKKKLTELANASN
ncbi:uncharacterized protein MAM_04435 [Metarhizium album ARSEF 1941]|uniref:Uncharacterized protein n=1 Tax=Metarhizium album (strain ARSEF 1941) TaxID=1081103 RepID=A0A0B2WX17_METAS|nr:uncharacterized protein MAM_04435 [Metarhizium album ARSEF 1941]KHN97420.1 hypothetical protein MAM_04435 [Metarhizium album ARSEF 1941]